jgi:pimeloyl-ACP methyl ester carboxylesterase
MRRAVRRALWIALALPALALLAGYIACRVELAGARRVLDAGSRIAHTACGPIEYAESGAGPAVLVVHGAGGGYTQTSALGDALAQSGLRAIRMSRFGYLRTPLPHDASPEAQADAHACLLDSLGVDRAAIVGASAGAPSAERFCIRHADRCVALVLLVPATYVPGRSIAQTTPPSPWFQFVLEHVLASDFLMWSVTRAAPEMLVETALATPLDVYRSATDAERARVDAMIADIFPVSLRAAGLRNDAAAIAALAPAALERITAPTLAISVEDDLYDTMAGARHVAERVPHARLLSWPTGGHVFVGHDDDVKAAIRTFVTAAYER